jgi:hypothetical protein
MSLKYGTIADDIETAVFALNVGEVTPPLESTYGYFVIRLDGERSDPSLPPFEEIEQNVARSVHDRKVTLATVAFVDEVFEDYNYQLNEDAVRILYDALPPDQELMPIPPQEEWGSLDLKPADMDLELMSYADEVWTLRRFYDYYEATPWLGRPRRDGTLGGLRRFLRKMVVRDLMPLAARDRGFMDRPEIVDVFKERREEAMVTQLYKELISADVEVTDEMVAEYWAENSHLYDKPIRHKGLVLISSNEEAVRTAYEEARAGADWDGLVMSYSESRYMPQTEGGTFGPVGQDREALATPLLWAGQAEGEVCQPIELQDGVWGIGRLEEIWPAESANLVDAGMQVKRVLESRESERLFQERVGAWRAEMPIKIYPERLDKAVYTPPVVEPPAALANPADAQGEEAQS